MKIFSKVKKLAAFSLALSAIAFPVNSICADTELIYGDANHDGVVDLTDLTLLSLRLMKVTEFDETTDMIMDVDINGITDIADLAKMKQYVCKEKVSIIGSKFTPPEIKEIPAEGNESDINSIHYFDNSSELTIYAMNPEKDDIAVPSEKFVFTMDWEASDESTAWIGLVPSDTPHGNASKEENPAFMMDLNEITENKAELTIPEDYEGLYDIRVYDNAENGKEKAYMTIVIGNYSFEPVYLSEENADFSVDINLPENKIILPDSLLSFTITQNGDLPKDGTAWIGVIPSATEHTEPASDAANADYKYLKNITDGEVTLKMPSKTGFYDIRVFDSDYKDPKEICSTTIYVSTQEKHYADEVVGVQRNTCLNSPIKVTISPESDIAYFGTSLNINMKVEGTPGDNAWVGIVPSGTTHTEADSDNYDYSFVYLKNIGEDGYFSLNIPYNTGLYDIRVFDANSYPANETAFYTVDVQKIKAEIACTDEEVYRGENVNLEVKVTGKVIEDAWMAFVPADTEHTEIASDYVNYTSIWVKDIPEDGICTLPVPTAKGEWEIRLFDTDNGSTASEIACLPVEILPESAEIIYDGNTAVAGTEVSLTVLKKGYYAYDAWMAFVPADTEHTEKAADAVNYTSIWVRDISEDGKCTLQVPTAPGQWEIRIFNADTAKYADEVACLPVEVITEAEAENTETAQPDAEADITENSETAEA